MLKLDHIVVSAETLAEGVDYVQDLLGVPIQPGGEHPAMGTHNRLLGLGQTYLEVIAINPDAPDPGRPRWFALDHFTGPPRLTNWMVSTGDLEAAIAMAPEGTGVKTTLSRGDLVWDVAMSADGNLPYGGAFPGIIAWGATAPPFTRLPVAGQLATWQVAHPQADALRADLTRVGGGLEAHITDAGPLAFRAEIETPHGTRVLT